MNSENKIYLDYASTTPLHPKILEDMMPYLTEKFGNAMSVHTYGQEALEGVDLARQKAADFFNCATNEIVFTSGATESNNLAIRGTVKAFHALPQNEGKLPHIITTSIEHHCVLDTCKAIEKEGLAEITVVPVNKEGVVDSQAIMDSIKNNTILISVMYVNNEIGTVQPIAEMGRLLKEKNDERVKNKQNSIIFHTDATQAIAYFDCNVENLKVDMLSMSAHKIYGPKGVGLLYVRRGTQVKRIQEGGDQEYKMRAGTQNVPGIVGLGSALDYSKKEGKSEKIKELRDYLIERVIKEIPKSYLNGSPEFRSPNNANFRFDDVEGEGLLLSLDMEGIAASTGSACSSGALDPSHVLLALGLRHEQAHGSLRITIGEQTTKNELDKFIDVLKTSIQRLRSISGSILADYHSENK